MCYDKIDSRIFSWTGVEVGYPERIPKGSEILDGTGRDGPEPARDHSPGHWSLLWGKLVTGKLKAGWQEQRSCGVGR